MKKTLIFLSSLFILGMITTVPVEAKNARANKKAQTECVCKDTTCDKADCKCANCVKKEKAKKEAKEKKACRRNGACPRR